MARLQLYREGICTRGKTFLSLFKRGDDEVDLQKDGKSAGRLLLINIDNTVPVEAAQVDVDSQAVGLALNLHHLSS